MRWSESGADRGAHPARPRARTARPSRRGGRAAASRACRRASHCWSTTRTCSWAPKSRRSVMAQRPGGRINGRRRLYPTAQSPLLGLSRVADQRAIDAAAQRGHRARAEAAGRTRTSDQDPWWVYEIVFRRERSMGCSPTCATDSERPNDDEADSGERGRAAGQHGDSVCPAADLLVEARGRSRGRPRHRSRQGRDRARRRRLRDPRQRRTADASISSASSRFR